MALTTWPSDHAILQSGHMQTWLFDCCLESALTIDIFVIGPKECRLHLEYILSMYYAHFYYGDHVLLWPARPMLWSWLYLHNEYQLKISSFFYLGHVFPSSEIEPTWSYSTSKTPVFNASFRVFIQQKCRTVAFCHGKSMIGTQMTPFLSLCI